MKKFHLTFVLMLFASCFGLSAQTESVYKRGATYIESTLPPSPEPASIVKYAGIPFTHSCGLVEYDVPFYTLEGRELSIPIGLHYASNGIKLDEVAGVAGLGWTLEAGGCITRTVMDMPDEFSAPAFCHELPSGDLLSDLESMSQTNEVTSYLTRIIKHQVDSSLDRYDYNVCGLSGSFFIEDDGSIFQIRGDGVKIEYIRSQDGSINSFTLTGPDGTVYILSEKENAVHEGRTSYMTTPMSGQPDRWSATTAWHITEMRSRSGLESAMFSYSDPMEWRRKIYVPTSSITAQNGQGQLPSYSTRNKIEYIHNSYESKVITRIEIEGMYVNFTYSTGTGKCLHKDSGVGQNNFPFKLSGISAYAHGNEVELCRLDVGTTQDVYDGRIILNNLDLYKGGVLDDTWEFQYRGIGKSVSHYSQDWYGYYNGHNEFPFISTIANPYRRSTSTCPYEFANSSAGVHLDLVNGHPDPTYADYMSLTDINHDGMRSHITYEGNKIQGLNDTLDVGLRVKRIISPGADAANHIRKFEYESPVPSGPTEPFYQLYMNVDCIHQPSNNSEYFSITYTLNSSPIYEGPSIRDTKVYYGRVTEYDYYGPIYWYGDQTYEPLGNMCTVYDYDVSDICDRGNNVGQRFPSKWSYVYDSTLFGCSPWQGVCTDYSVRGTAGTALLLRKAEYTAGDESWKLLSSLENTYDVPDRNAALVGYHATQVMENEMFYGQVNYSDIYHYPIKAFSSPARNPIETIKVEYHSSGNDTTVVNTSYVSRSSLSDPVRVSDIRVRDAGLTRVKKFHYADTWEGNELWTSDLVSQHCLATPLKVEYKDLSPFGNWGVVGPLQPLASIPELPAFRTVQLKEELTEYTWTNVGDDMCLLPSSHIETTGGIESWRENILTRDGKGNITSFKEKGHPETVIMWGYGGLLPVAVITNASFAEVQSVFDYPSEMDELSAAEIPSQIYLDALHSLRTSLSDAHVTIYTHTPGIGVSSVTDPAGITTTYEYDSAGRLSCMRDNDGNRIKEYDYHFMNNDKRLKHMRSKTFLSADGNQYYEDVRWWDMFGRRREDISIGAAGDGRDLVTAYDSDYLLFDDNYVYLPYPVAETEGEYQANASTSSSEYHDEYAPYFYKSYEYSSRGRVLSTALPGYVRRHVAEYEKDIVSGFPILKWQNNGIDSTGVYDSDCVIVDRIVDADGRVTSTYTDHFGKTLGTSDGTGAMTYYVYDSYDRLRAVAGPEVEFTDTLNMWRYDYDSLGRISSKGIPGSVREYYSYDDEDRVIAILRDGVLKEMEYDAMNRVTKVLQTRPGGQRIILEEHAYDVYPSGVTGANPKGKKTQSRIAIIAPNSYVTGYTRITWSYDEKGRPVVVKTRHTDGSEQIEELDYDFAGEVSSSTSTYAYGNKLDVLSVDYTYDQRGRLKIETATLTPSASAPQTAKVIHSYDDLGRPSGTSSLMQNCPRLTTSLSYTLQGWTDTVSVSLNDSPLFIQSLGYDSSNVLNGTVPQYTGLITKKNDKWIYNERLASSRTDGYAYDPSGRLARSGYPGKFREYTYDSRGNILSETLPGSAGSFDYEYDGDRLISLTSSSAAQHDTVTFTHDALGRMTFDGMTGQSMTYNDLDLIGNIVRNDTTLVNYSYLSDGTKLSALDGSGAGLVYRGPFVYRKSSGGNAGSSLTLESAAFGGGLMTPSGAMLYVTDYLGSVRAVVDGKTGDLYKASDYSAFGDESVVMVSPQGDTPPHPLATAVLPDGQTLRDGYTGKEAQNEDFGTSYTDFGARQYSPALRRWMTPDPLSEKYYGVSPYAFCNNNPVNLVDPDGEAVETLWDIASIGMGVRSFVKNIKSGNVRGAVGDALGIAVDAVAAAVPFVPGGLGAIRAGVKTVDATVGVAKGINTFDNATDAAKAAASVSDGKVYVTYTKVDPKTGEVYSGRASGYGTPNEVVANRDRKHHMNEKGFEPAELDKSSTNPDAIRGREQQLIELHGGAKSQGGSSGNAINGISKTNPNRQRYEDARRKEFNQ